jgi:hypothetical protein
MNDEGKGHTPAIGRTKPEMVAIGDRKVMVGGRWNNDAMADYIIENGQDDWIPIGKLARDGCGANTIPNKKRVRSRLSQLFILFRDRGLWLAIDYGGDHNSAVGVKVANIGLTEDRQNVEAKLERMRKRKELTEENYERSLALLHATMRGSG